MNDVYDYVSPGDALTFLSLLSAFANNGCLSDKQFNIFDHEYSYDSETLDIIDKKSGQWNRNVDPVFEIDLSRSGISTEGILGVLHSIWTRQDKEAINRLYDFGDENNWIMGVGPTEYTRLWHLVPIISEIHDLLNENVSLIKKYTETEYGYAFLELISIESDLEFVSKNSEDAWTNSWDKISEYRGNVIVSYIFLKGRVTGKIYSAEKLMLKILVEKAWDCPIYHALYNLFDKGDQSIAMSIANDTRYFPENEMPDPYLRLFHWGEAPAPILYIYLAAILQNK